MREVLRGELNPLHGEMEDGGWGWGVALLESLLWPCNQIQTFGDTLTAHLRCLSVVKSSQGCEGG